MKQKSEDPFSYAVIGKAMQVHRELGPGVDEAFYHELLSVRLSEAGIAHENKVRQSLTHRGFTADTFEADLLFPDRMIAELKCLQGGFDPEHYVQIFCYLKFWNLTTGLLLDFAKDSLMQRRVNYAPTKLYSCAPESILEGSLDFGFDRDLCFAVCLSASRIASEYGGGYRDTTYRGLLTADLHADRVGCVPTPVALVQASGRVLGETRCDCLSIGGRLGVLVLALKDSITATDIATLRTYVRLLNLQHGLALNFAKERLERVWIRSRPT